MLWFYALISIPKRNEKEIGNLNFPQKNQNLTCSLRLCINSPLITWKHNVVFYGLVVIIAFLVLLLSVTEHIFQVINHISLIVIYGQVEINTKKNEFMKICVPLAFCEVIEIPICVCEYEIKYEP